MLPSIRQLLYPKEFRIAAPKWPALSGAVEDIVNLLKLPYYNNGVESRQESESLNLIVDIGTVIWRLRRRLPADSELAEQTRRISRDLESAWDTLRQGGIEIKDHSGEKYDGGMALHVIAFQPVVGLSREQIIETIKPTIYCNNKIVRMGDVIVGVPEGNSTLET